MSWFPNLILLTVLEKEEARKMIFFVIFVTMWGRGGIVSMIIPARSAGWGTRPATQCLSYTTTCSISQSRTKEVKNFFGKVLVSSSRILGVQAGSFGVRVRFRPAHASISWTKPYGSVTRRKIEASCFSTFAHVTSVSRFARYALVATLTLGKHSAIGY